MNKKELLEDLLSVKVKNSIAKCIDVDWDSISEIPNLSSEFIEKYKYYLNWEKINYKNLSVDTIKKCSRYICWDALVYYKTSNWIVENLLSDYAKELWSEGEFYDSFTESKSTEYRKNYTNKILDYIEKRYKNQSNKVKAIREFINSNNTIPFYTKIRDIHTIMCDYYIIVKGKGKDKAKFIDLNIIPNNKGLIEIATIESELDGYELNINNITPKKAANLLVSEEKKLNL